MKELSREELLAQIELLKKQVKTSEKLAKSAEKKAAKAEKKVVKLEQKNELLLKRAENAEDKQRGADQYARSLLKQLQTAYAIRKIALEALPFLCAMAEKLNDRLTDDPVWNDVVVAQFKSLLGQLEPLRHGRSVLINVLGKGNEKVTPPSKKEMEAVDNALQAETSKLLKSALHQVKNGVVVNKLMQQAIAQAKRNGAQGDVVTTMDAIANSKLSDDAQKFFDERSARAEVPGRQIVERTLPELTVSAAELPKGLICPVCGGRKFHVIEQTPAAKMIGTVDKFVSLMKVSVLEETFAECANTECGTVLPIFKENAPMALNKKREITIDTLVAAADVVNSGMPLNRAEDVFFPELKTGSSTLSENLHQMGLYAKPLIEAIEKQAHQESVIIADETPFDILQAEGRGHQKQAQEEASDGEADPCSRSYMQAVTSTEGSETPFVLYYPMAGRSTDCIAKVLTPFEATCIMSDGYAAYGKLIRETKSNTHHASCLVHWRREVLKAADLENQNRFIERVSGKKAIGSYSERIVNGDALPILNSVLLAVSKIFAEEKSVIRMAGESRQDYLKRVGEHRQEYEKPYMDKIDLLMKQLGQMANLKARGKNYKVDTADKTFYSDAVVYYFNRREELRYFLEHPECPPSSNEVECTIRPLTIIRKNSYFLQSLDYARTFCALMSLFETAERNGIRDPSKWLRTYYYRLAQHCQREQWIAHTRPGCEKRKNPYTTFVKWEYEKYWHTMPIGDLLPWNYAKTEVRPAED